MFLLTYQFHGGSALRSVKRRHSPLTIGNLKSPVCPWWFLEGFPFLLKGEPSHVNDSTFVSHSESI